jgi:hypothetical protein
MFALWLEPVPWSQFGEAVANKGEMEFQSIEQRISEAQTEEGMAPTASEPMVGATVVAVRSLSTTSAFRKASGTSTAQFATGMLLSGTIQALPKGAALDLIIETEAAHTALKACADIVTGHLDPSKSCWDEGWRRVIDSWQTQCTQAQVRAFQEGGVDSENTPLRMLAHGKPCRQ